MSTLHVALPTGYVVEVFGTNKSDGEGWNSIEYLILGPYENLIFQGLIHMDGTLDIPIGLHGAALLGVLKGLQKDTERLVAPHRYDDPKDRGLVIASNEPLQLWLRTMDNSFLDAIGLIGSPRIARTVYDNSHYEQTHP